MENYFSAGAKWRPFGKGLRNHASRSSKDHVKSVAFKDSDGRGGIIPYYIGYASGGIAV